MRNNKIYNLILFFIVINLIIFIIMSNKSCIVDNKKIIFKNMEETEEIANLNNSISTLNASHTDYANYIQTAKQKIANAINEYPNNNVSEQNTLEDFSTMISNLTNIPENTYYYEKGTEGNESTIVRYKKVADQYYKCDEHGEVVSGTTATDVSSLTLIPYTATTSKDLNSGTAGYASGNFYLGDGANNTSYTEFDVLYTDAINGKFDTFTVTTPGTYVVSLTIMGYNNSGNITTTGNILLQKEISDVGTRRQIIMIVNASIGDIIDMTASVTSEFRCCGMIGKLNNKFTSATLLNYSNSQDVTSISSSSNVVMGSKILCITTQAMTAMQGSCARSNRI